MMSIRKKILVSAAVAPVALFGMFACAHLVMMNGVSKPDTSEFGFGPRTTAGGAYTVTIEEQQQYRTGKMLSTVISVQDKGGNVIEGAEIRVDGGMPQHGHGLPTKPRVSKNLGNGRYQVDGLKFNMGGWWELKFAIATDAASDSVTFNLEL
jgi:hypothetical protein